MNAMKATATVSFGIVLSVGAMLAACGRRDCPGDGPTVAPSTITRPAAPATGQAETTGADLRTTPEDRRARSDRAPSADVGDADAAVEAPVFTEEVLPPWVPRSGRLTIVHGADRDRNLGIVPPPERAPATDVRSSPSVERDASAP
jgi:hypothetical protein